MGYKVCKSCENRARDTPLRGVYISHFGQIWVKISIFGVLHPCRFTDGWNLAWRRGPSSSMPNFTPSVQRVALRGENLKIGLWVNKIPAACAARNAAGNQLSHIERSRRRRRENLRAQAEASMPASSNRFTILLWPRCVADANISLTNIFPPGFFFYLLFPRLISAVRDWMFAILPHMMWP